MTCEARDIFKPYQIEKNQIYKTSFYVWLLFRMDSGDEFDPFDEPQDQVLDPGKYEPQSEGRQCMRENHIEVNNMGEKYKVCHQHSCKV